MLSRCVSRLFTHLSKLGAPRARFLKQEGRHEEMQVSQEQVSRRDADETGSRKCRVTVLKDLVEQRAYDVPGEDVAASIIRDAIVIAAPAPPRPN